MVKMDKEITYLVKYTDKTQDKPMPATKFIRDIKLKKINIWDIQTNFN